MGGKKPLKSRILFIIVFVLDVIAMIPAYYYTVNYERIPAARAVYKAIAETVESFKFKGSYDAVTSFISIMPQGLAKVYSVITDILFILSPIVTIGFILSFFYAVRAYNHMLLKRNRDTYIFSSVNDKSLTLAKSIKENHPKSLIIFADTNTEEKRHKTGDTGYCIKKTMDDFDLVSRGKAAVVSFFAINDSESENIDQSIKIIEKYKNSERVRLYSFVSSAESEIILASNKDKKIKVRRINTQRALIYRYLFENGKTVFDNADNGEIRISICGLGMYGMELLKAMPWYCQMPGYKVKIQAFDVSPSTEDRFKAMCPELMDDKHNGVSVKGESEYKIEIHDNCDVYGTSFSKEIAKFKPTDVFVCLGDDENNIACALNIRKLLSRDNLKTRIQSFIYESGKIERIENAINYSGRAYDIKCIGAPENEYTEEVVIDSQLEKLALERHLKWGDEQSFWEYEFNYCSSEASAIGIKLRDEMNIHDKDLIQEYEHKRWNAYMRSEGYIYSGKRDKSSKNSISKLHPDLVPLDDLSIEDKNKDF